jgi:hypothetical protein
MRDPLCSLLELRDFLILPLQRLCKYPLLFKELVAKTPANHPDLPHYEASKIKAEDVVSAVNESKRIGQNQQKLQAIQAAVEGCPVCIFLFMMKNSFRLFEFLIPNHVVVVVVGLGGFFTNACK